MGSRIKIQNQPEILLVFHAYYSTEDFGRKLIFGSESKLIFMIQPHRRNLIDCSE